ncbi:MAG: CDP-glycerol glycerophosphotransferase family protein [Eubacterium sp.]
MKDFFLKIYRKLFSALIPLKNYILLESFPDFTDNTRAVFNEMIRQGFNKKYTLIWVANQKSGNFYPVPDEKNVKIISRYSLKYKLYYNLAARVLISCNVQFNIYRKGQIYIYLTHGTPFKDTGKNLHARNCSGLFVPSKAFYPVYKSLFGVEEEQIFLTGFARNDYLLSEGSHDFHKIFEAFSYERLVIWLPTYRQNSEENYSSSSISFPVIHSLEDAKKINACAKENSVLILIKPHFAQDILKIKNLKLSNICFIDDCFLQKNDLQLYELLGESDALISDYSSSVFDYLLTDRPIGLTWEDIDEYRENRGFAIDESLFSAAGEKIYSTEDFCRFISNVNNATDNYKSGRKELLNSANYYNDNKSAKRCVDVITELLNKKY